MLTGFAVVLAFFVVAIAFMVAPLVAQRIVAPRKPTPEKLTSYECGEDAIGTPWIKFNIRFYVFALLFLIFDVEIIFVLPWAVVYRNLAAHNQVTVERAAEFAPQSDNVFSMNEAAAEPAPGQSGSEVMPPSEAPDAAAPIERRLTASESWGPVWLPFVEGVTFILILVVGLVYAWAKGDLEWVRPRRAFDTGAATAEPPREKPLHAANA